MMDISSFKRTSAAILVPFRNTIAKLMTSEELNNWSEFISAQLSSTEINSDSCASGQETLILFKTLFFKCERR